MERVGCMPSLGITSCASVESELALMRGTLNVEIGQSGLVINPFYMATTHFATNAQEIYLVTRLDGYTVDDVKTLIDRSGPNTLVNKSNNNFEFDISYINSAQEQDLFETSMEAAIAGLQSEGWI